MQENGKAQRDTYLLEVIVCSLEDALQAEQGQADRLELVRELDRGGLTPSLDLLCRIKKETRLPLRVMLREKEDYTKPSHNNCKTLKVTLAELDKIGIDGVVMGFLWEGEVDVEAMTEVLSATPRLPVTFHHAFDETRSPIEALERLRELPQIDRVLTSGGRGDVFTRAARLESYRQAAGEAISILAGGGVDRNTLPLLLQKTSVREFHVGRAARHPGSRNVRAQLVADLKKNLRDAEAAKLAVNHSMLAP